MPEIIGVQNDGGPVCHMQPGVGGLSMGTIFLPPANMATANTGGNGITLDDTAPPTMAISGTAGRSQFVVMQFAKDTASSIVYIDVILPNDFSARANLNLFIYWFCADNTAGKTSYWTTTWRVVHGDGTAIIDTAGTAGAVASQAVPTTVNRLTKSRVKCPSAVLAALKPGDHLLIQVYSDIGGANIPGAVMEVPYMLMTYERA